MICWRMCLDLPRIFLSPYAFIGVVVLGLISTALLAGQAWERIEADELNRRLHSVTPPLVLDIRGRDAYLAGSLPQALNAGTDPAGFLPDGRGGDLVLITPQPLDEAQLQPWVKRLVNAHHRVWVLRGGIDAWRAAGLPLVETEQVYTRPGTVPFVIPRGLCEGAEPAQEYY